MTTHANRFDSSRRSSVTPGSGNERLGMPPLGYFFPRDITYFCLPFYHHFSARPYHARTVRQDWDVKRLREDLAAALIRSEIRVDPELPANQEQIQQLLFRLADDVFCHRVSESPVHGMA